jgi:hypothetical protein
VRRAGGPFRHRSGRLCARADGTCFFCWTPLLSPSTPDSENATSAPICCSTRDKPGLDWWPMVAGGVREEINIIKEGPPAGTCVAALHRVRRVATGLATCWRYRVVRGGGGRRGVCRRVMVKPPRRCRYPRWTGGERGERPERGGRVCLHDPRRQGHDRAGRVLLRPMWGRVFATPDVGTPFLLRDVGVVIFPPPGQLREVTLGDGGSPRLPDWRPGDQRGLGLLCSRHGCRATRLTGSAVCGFVMVSCGGGRVVGFGRWAGGWGGGPGSGGGGFGGGGGGGWWGGGGGVFAFPFAGLRTR